MEYKNKAREKLADSETVALQVEYMINYLIWDNHRTVVSANYS